MDSKDTKRLRLAIILGSVILFVGGGLYWARDKFGGLRNLFSSQYWHERSTGEDMYDAKTSIFKRGSREHPDLLLTIDDGPHPASLPRILDVLKRYHVHATFFLVGKMVKLHPDLVRRIIAEGHEIGNHTEDHLRLDRLTEKQVRAELADCDTNIAKATGRSTRLMRPPGMRFNPTVLKVTREMGYTCVDWNLAAKDFVPAIDKHEPTAIPVVNVNLDPHLISDRIVNKVQNGEIILLHDIPATADALPDILERLLAKGFTFKSTAEMLAEIPQHVLMTSNPPARRVTLTAQKERHLANPLSPKRLPAAR